MDGGSLPLMPTHAQSSAHRDQDALGGADTPPVTNATETLDSAVQTSLDDSSCPTLRPPSPSTVLLADSTGPIPDPGTAGAPAPSSPSASILTTTTPPRLPAGHHQFRAHTIAPSPPLSRSPRAPSPHTLTQLESHADDSHPQTRPTAAPSNLQSPGSSHSVWTGHAGAFQPLRLQTDVIQATVNSLVSSISRQQPDPLTLGALPPSAVITTPVSSYIRPSTLVLQHKSSSASLKPVSRTPSLKTTGFHGFGTASAASSTVPSPIISAMGDVTPLPSPLLSGDSPGPWKKLGRSPPNDTLYHPVMGPPESASETSNGESLASALAHHAKRKAYAELLAGSPSPGRITDAGYGRSGLQPTHTRDRSLSEYTPDPLQVPKRMVTVSASHSKQADGCDHPEPSYEPHMRREPHLSEARGLTPVEKPPTPPPSESSMFLNDAAASSERGQASSQDRHEYFEARDRDDQKRRRWRSIKLLGQGTFSRVILATNQISPPPNETTQNSRPGTNSGSASQSRYDRSTLVAIKVCEHGPKGGASEDRIEMSLKRELEIMQCISHPSLVRLKAWNIEPTRAILVLSYCPGGDLFDVVSTHRDILSPRLLARIFSELVGAVRYLHGQHIVHRDIKLENVLVNLTAEELADNTINWQTYPYSVTTLTDLGLSRRVADDEKLETRCGSDDYAAPEVIMGQPYDGRATDAWSLGVLLYALLESRLPFDPNPGMSDAHRMRSRTSHRIARVEWRWIQFAGDDGDHEGDFSKFQANGLEGAMEITEGLLKRARSRWTLDRVAEIAWVRNALTIDGGLQFREEAVGEEVL